MSRRTIKSFIILVIILSTALCSCSGPSGIYIDLKNQAICTCDGKGLKEIRIENDSSKVKLEGTRSIIYFNKVNSVSRTTIYGDVVYDYVLKLKPNSNYRVKKINGYDQGPFTITFKTDGTGKVITASNINCN
jgi:outer membrane protein assembly factor BamE (lipoprotein component of BamABCDE complex)